MNILVLGCNGMAGHMISLYFSERGHHVVGFDRAPSKLVESVAGDARDQEFLKKLIQENEFDAVINCIGILNQAAEDNKALAAYLNSYLPHFLVDVTKSMKTRVVHMSTDCVFSGKRGQYTENDFPDGTTFYDRSKALGEINDDKNITLRNSIVGPDINPKGIGLMNWFMQQNGSVNGYTKAMWTGQTTLQLAKTMEYVIEHNATGLVNAVPSTSIAKSNLLKLFNKYLRNNEIIVNDVEGVSADKSLVRTNFSFDYQIPDYEIMVKELGDWIRAHTELYPHYQIGE